MKNPFRKNVDSAAQAEPVLSAEDSKVKYTIDRKSFFGHSALLMLGMSAIFRIIGCWGLWSDRLFAVMHIILPVSCCILLMLCVIFLGRKGFFLSFIPVILGVVFFIYKSFSFESRIHTVLCIVLYLSVAVLYTATMLGSIRTKWLLPPLFGLPFIYHVFVEDLPALSNTAQPVTFSAGMQEMSVLCTMAALFFIGMGLKKHVLPRETVIIAEPAMADMPSEPEIGSAAPVLDLAAAAAAEESPCAQTPVSGFSPEDKQSEAEALPAAEPVPAPETDTLPEKDEGTQVTVNE